MYISYTSVSTYEEKQYDAGLREEKECSIQWSLQYISIGINEKNLNKSRQSTYIHKRYSLLVVLYYIKMSIIRRFLFHSKKILHEPVLRTFIFLGTGANPLDPTTDYRVCVKYWGVPGGSTGKAAATLCHRVNKRRESQ